MEVWLCLGAIVLVLVVFVTLQKQEQERIQAARRAYNESLRTLKSSPTDPKLRERALMLGRRYASLTRKSQKVTTYDEVAIMNDINAVTAASQKSSPSSVSIEERLKHLNELKEKELITTDEYRERRQAILDEI